LGGRLAIWLTAGLGALACAWPATAGALAPPVSDSPMPFNRAGQLAISPDGENAYVAADYLTIEFARNETTGELTKLGFVERGGRTLEMTPDGRFLYQANDDPSSPFGIVSYRRGADGRLTQTGIYRGNDPARPLDLQASPNARQLYATGGDRIVVLEPDEKTGALAYGGDLKDGTGGAHLQSPRGLEMSGDGRFLYVTVSDGITTLRRDANGHLSNAGFTDTLSCGCYAADLERSPDGSRLLFAKSWGFYGPDEVSDGQVVVAPSNEAAYAIDPPGNRLIQLAMPTAGAPPPEYSPLTGAIERDPQSGELGTSPEATPLVRRYHEGLDGMRGLRYARSLTLSPDGRFLYVSSEDGGWQSRGRIAVLKRDPATDRLSFASLFVGPLGAPTNWSDYMEINDGDEYTNDPHVTINMHHFVGEAVDFSNDAGFRDVKRMKITQDDRYEWVLASTGPDKLAKTVYGRIYESGTFWPRISDSIVLDESPPEVVAARLESGGKKLAVRAKDKISGVAKVQLAKDPKHPGGWRRYSPKAKYSVPSRDALVRVRDRAGNRSHWRKVEG
jgi:6-phosphogluconolactonase (cycloisomerase 2 family)